MNNTAIVLGGTHDHITLIGKLKNRGYSVVLVDYYDNSPAKQYADIHVKESTLDQDVVLRVAKEQDAKLIVTACIDQALTTMCYVAENMGLPKLLDYETSLLVTNKIKMKERMFSCDLPTTEFSYVSRSNRKTYESLDFPLVVKPADCNGSFGIKMVSNSTQLEVALNEAVSISRTGGAIVEKFVDWSEISVDAFIGDDVEIVLITRTGKSKNEIDGFRIHKSVYLPGVNYDLLTNIKNTIRALSEAFNLKNTPVLVQFFEKDGQLKIIEMGVRIGGGSKIHLIQRASGIDFLEMYLAALHGDEVGLVGKVPNEKFVSISYVYCQDGVIGNILGVENQLACGNMEDCFLYKNKGDTISGHFVSRDRLMGFLSEANSEDELSGKIKSAFNGIEIVSSDGMHSLLMREIQ